MRMKKSHVPINSLLKGSQAATLSAMAPKKTKNGKGKRNRDDDSDDSDKFIQASGVVLTQSLGT